MRFNWNLPYRFLKLPVVTLCVILVAQMLTVAAASALPFNQDMVGNQMITGSIMRPKAAHSVPYGSLGSRLESKDAAAKLENPLKGNPLSVVNGERLFNINCSVCHGKYPDGKQQPAAPPLDKIGAVDLSQEMYKSSRTDGQIFSVIHFGGMAIMPPYGWKLSNDEKWDIVNYVRKFQGVR